MLSVLSRFVIVFFVIASDQITKKIVLDAFELGRIPLPITSFFDLVFVWNPGISFGLFAERSVWVFGGVIIMTSLLSLYFVFMLVRTVDKWLIFCFGLILGGAIGNIIDRLRFRAVIDFLDFHIGGYHWPAFNLADASIMLGFGLWLYHQIMIKPKTAHGDR